MADDPELVAVDLVARTEKFDGKLEQSATEFTNNMKRIENAADKAETKVRRSMDEMAAATARSSRTSKQLGLQVGQIGSQLAVGTSPFIIMAQQSSDLAYALDGVGGKFGKVIGFLGTWQGALLLAAGTIALQFLPRLFDMNHELDDAIDKLRENADKADLARRAQEAFGKTIEGVGERIRKTREELEKLNLVQQTAAEKALGEANQELATSAKLYQDQVDALELAKQRLQNAIKNPVSIAYNAEDQAAQLFYLQRQLEKVNDQLEKAKKNRDAAKAAVATAQSQVVVEAALRTEEERINRLYDQRIESARKLALANGTVATKLEEQVRQIEKAREADLKRIRDQKKEANAAAPNLSPVTGQEIARALGTSVNSGFRTAARNKAVGGSANSYHLGGPNAAVQAIDIPLTVNGKPLTKAGIRAALGPLGVEIKELLGPGDKNHDDHFHIAFSRKRVGADKINNDAEKLADQEERRRQAFENELANLLSGELDARQALVTNAEELVKLELDSIDIARKRYNDNLQSLVATDKLTAEEAAILQGINEERAKLRAELVKRREAERQFRLREADLQRQGQFASEQRNTAAELLQGMEQLADTQRERREIERRLIDLQYQEERARNDYLIGYYQRLKTQEGISESELAEAKAQADIATLRNSSLDQRKANTQAASDRGTAGPFQAYLDTLPDTVGQVNEALEAVAAGGLQTFVDSLTDAIVNFRSLGDVGRAVLQSLTAGLVKLAIQQLILKAVSATVGTAAVAGTNVLASSAAAAWAPAAALASLATLGANAGPAAAALAATTGLAAGLAIGGGGLGLRDGGPVWGPGGPRDDKVAIRGSNGEYMIQARSVRKLGRAALDHINRTGELPYAYGGPIGGIVPDNSPARRTGGGGESSLSADSINRLGQIVAEAAKAMPDVKLYPTLDPGAAMQAALASPGGSRAMFDFINQNQGRFRSALEQ